MLSYSQALGEGGKRRKKMLVGSLATSCFPVALSALPMPAPHITVHAGISAACPQVVSDVGGCTGYVQVQPGSGRELTLPGQPALEVEWELVNNCSSFLPFGLTIRRFIPQFFRVPRVGESQLP